jgi:hypothetical protein
MRMRNISNAFVERIKTHILCSITFLLLENHAVYEIMRKDSVEPGRLQMAIGCMRIG